MNTIYSVAMSTPKKRPKTKLVLTLTFYLPLKKKNVEEENLCHIW